jgi:hypothetical protein
MGYPDRDNQFCLTSVNTGIYYADEQTKALEAAA